MNRTGGHVRTREPWHYTLTKQFEKGLKKTGIYAQDFSSVKLDGGHTVIFSNTPVHPMKAFDHNTPHASHHQAVLEYNEPNGSMTRFTIIHGHHGVKTEGFPTEEGMIKAGELLKKLRETMGRYIEK